MTARLLFAAQHLRDYLAGDLGAIVPADERRDIMEEFHAAIREAEPIHAEALRLAAGNPNVAEALAARCGCGGLCDSGHSCPMPRAARAA